MTWTKRSPGHWIGTHGEHGYQTVSLYRGHKHWKWRVLDSNTVYKTGVTHDIIFGNNGSALRAAQSQAEAYCNTNFVYDLKL